MPISSFEPMPGSDFLTPHGVDLIFALKVYWEACDTMPIL